jgi:hypothetical protein
MTDEKHQCSWICLTILVGRQSLSKPVQNQFSRQSSGILRAVQRVSLYAGTLCANDAHLWACFVCKDIKVSIKSIFITIIDIWSLVTLPKLGRRQWRLQVIPLLLRLDCSSSSNIDLKLLLLDSELLFELSWGSNLVGIWFFVRKRTICLRAILIAV